jgi:hypothetical protein
MDGGGGGGGRGVVAAGETVAGGRCAVLLSGLSLWAGGMGMGGLWFRGGRHFRE